MRRVIRTEFVDPVASLLDDAAVLRGVQPGRVVHSIVTEWCSVHGDAIASAAATVRSVQLLRPVRRRGRACSGQLPVASG